MPYRWPHPAHLLALGILGRRLLNVCVKFSEDEVASGVRSTSADTLSDQPLLEWPAGREADRTLAQRTAAVGLTDRGSLSELALMADRRLQLADDNGSGPRRSEAKPHWYSNRRSLPGCSGAGPVGRAGRPPLMIRCCAHNRRSDGGRRPQRRGRPCPLAGRAGGAAGPGRGPVPAGGTTPPRLGVGAWAAFGPATQELLEDRRARRPGHPGWDGSTCWRGRCGTTTGSAMTSATTWSSTSATPGRAGGG
jgi:hypothetical protein